MAADKPTSIANLHTVADRVRFLLDVRRMKQTELAAKIGLTQSAISNIVTNDTRKPSAPTLLKIAVALQASAYWIITGEGSPFEITAIGREDEQHLIEMYRDLDEQSRAKLLKITRAMRAKAFERARRDASKTSKR